MDYQRDYQSKLTSAEEAVKCIQSGDWVDYGWCTGTCYDLDIALAARMPEQRGFPREKSAGLTAQGKSPAEKNQNVFCP